MKDPTGAKHSSINDNKKKPVHKCHVQYDVFQPRKGGGGCWAEGQETLAGLLLCGLDCYQMT